LKSTREQEFVTLVEVHQNVIHKICRLYTKSSAEHKDLFQEITIQLWSAYPKFRGEAKFSTWMYRVGINTAISLYRKSKRKIQSFSFDDVAFKIPQDDSYDDTEDQQLSAIYHAVKQLNDIDKALVFLYLEDKSYKEISETMGISEVNARVRMNRVKKKLKQQLNP
jgi:RNA polymerase sigma factor (sigma-70 family)